MGISFGSLVGDKSSICFSRLPTSIQPDDNDENGEDYNRVTDAQYFIVYHVVSPISLKTAAIEFILSLSAVLQAVFDRFVHPVCFAIGLAP